MRWDTEQKDREVQVLLKVFGDTISDIYGEVNSVKNTTINIWLNDGVY